MTDILCPLCNGLFEREQDVIPSALHPQIAFNIEQSEKDGGIWLRDVRGTVKVQTLNTLYTLTDIDPATATAKIQGHPRYCLVPTACRINGSTWGGSMLKVGFIGRGMHLEFSVNHPDGVITTSQIKRVWQEVE